jgi:hypothetical protein
MTIRLVVGLLAEVDPHRRRRPDTYEGGAQRLPRSCRTFIPAVGGSWHGGESEGTDTMVDGGCQCCVAQQG